MLMRIKTRTMMTIAGGLLFVSETIATVAQYQGEQVRLFRRHKFFFSFLKRSTIKDI